MIATKLSLGLVVQSTISLLDKQCIRRYIFYGNLIEQYALKSILARQSKMVELAGLHLSVKHPHLIVQAYFEEVDNQQ